MLLAFAESAVHVATSLPPPDPTMTARVVSGVPFDAIVVGGVVIIGIVAIVGVVIVIKWLATVTNGVSRVNVLFHESKDAHVPHAELVKTPPVAAALTAHVVEWTQSDAFRSAVVGVLRSSEAGDVWTQRASGWVTTDGFSVPVAKIAEYKANGAAQGIGNQISKDLRLAIDEAVAARFEPLEKAIDGLRADMGRLVDRVDKSIDRHSS